MRKFTLFALAALISVVAFAQKQRLLPQAQVLQRTTVQFSPVQKTKATASTTKRVAKAPAELVTPPAGATAETYYTASGNFYVSGQSDWEDATADMKSVNVAVVGTDIYVQGLAYWFKDGWIKGTISGTTATFEGGQLVGTDEYGDEFIVGSNDGSTLSENIVFTFEPAEGILTAVTPYILESSKSDAISPYCFWYSPVFTKEEPAGPEVVVAPEGLETEEYAVSARNYKDDADVSGVWHIGFDGNDVYVQGMCSYIPEAWAKGTLEGTTITFATGQYFGNYANTYDMYLNVLLGADVVFDYDAEAGNLTAQNAVFLTDNNSYYFDSYRNAVIKKVVEKAATPANPAITALKNGNYGWYITFNVPNVDVDGNGMVASKISYIIYTDIEGEIAPLTFTPATHEKLTEDMTEIPFGFTENYDFYDTQIFLNDLYSANWNNLGIQSIYRGGGEENVTEIQWYHIKDYSGPVSGDVTFDFNAMDVATSANGTTDGDITEALTLTEGSVSLTISPKDESATTANRFWSTNSGPQLRVYSGTLTFSVPEGSTITGIDISAGKWNDGNTFAPASEDIEGAVAAGHYLWEGSESKVVLTIAGNTQINNIVVTVEGGNTPVVDDDVLVTLPAGVEPVEYTLSLEGATSQGTISTESTKLVAFDGDDVYVQGLAYYFEDAYVKGTRNAQGQYAFKSGQFVGEDEYGKEYLVGVSVDAESNFVYEPEFVFDFDAQTGTLSLVEGTYYGESGTKDQPDLWTYFESAVYTVGALVLPDVVELPEGIEPETWYLSATAYSGNINGQEVGVAIDGSDIYLQGLCTYLPEAWVKGTISGNTATFASGQYYGKYADQYNLFFVGFDEDDNLLDPVFTYDAEAGTLTLAEEQYIALNGKQDALDMYDYMYYVEITREQPAGAVEAPEDLATETYLFKAASLEYDEEAEEDAEPEFVEYSTQVEVGFDGNDAYIQGLAADCPELWVKATKNEAGQYVIPANQYMGTYDVGGIGWVIYDYYFTAVDEESNLVDVVLNYNAETNTFSTDQLLALNGDRKTLYYYQLFQDVTITKMNDFAATPADPSVTAFTPTGSYPSVQFNIPAKDVDGNDLLGSKLFYTIWIEKDGTAQPLTLEASLYEALDEDMTEIPYTFRDDFDIYAGGTRVYLNQSAEEIATWTKIGVQSIYRGGGEENKSNTVWFDASATGIANVNTANNAAVYFDLQGRMADAAQKGLLIKQTRNADGTVSTVKVVRK